MEKRPNDMESEATGFLRTAVLEWHMKSIEKNAPIARINRAYCMMAARNLRKTFDKMSDPSHPPLSLRLLDTFASADMLIQSMSCDGWEIILNRHFTCIDSFVRLYMHIPDKWGRISVMDLERELQEAASEDEVTNASKYLQLLRSGAKNPTFIMYEIADRKKKGELVNESELSEEQVICFFRDNRYNCWRLRFEELTPPDGGTHKELVIPGNMFLLFDMHNGYRYNGAAVRLYELEEINGRRISRETLSRFRSDLISYLHMSHPNIVPYIGLYDEKLPTPDGDATKASVKPIPALGFIVKDVTKLTVRSVVDDNANTSLASYIVFPSSSPKDVTYVSLHELLFFQRRRFTLRDAFGITIQVADAFHYISSVNTRLSSEALEACTVLAPSNIFVCPILPADETGIAAGTERGRSSSCSEQECVVDDREMEEKHVRFLHLPATGNFAVMYLPPVYDENSPFSRWKPHPHAASPVNYALTQLFLALISNEPPYRHLVRQKDLTALIFRTAETWNQLGDEVLMDDLASVPLPSEGVNIPIGSVIPAGLPAEIRQFCERGLLLRQSLSDKTTEGPTLDDFCNDMYAMFENAADETVELTEQRCYENTGDSSGVSQSIEIPSSPEVAYFRIFLDDYGDLFQ
ncbi:hypothetical protein MOQ_002310 [Trypanosoma cruzi marinkellei]|uniref:Protein kinase domain-containing protein n=1 Tax=Trypanosoma cruzi marinkellei TaxID=85056 RepID=K2NLU6_TRYCR|nr:hypothetical protein MOQ_002310 [Trypanosoma cruzi marinkellei]